ncbi:hypothetical protein NE237_025203 [Protea cynaroides]|uniref:Uncharacterized protein n=1 Tax=Protea cynaroides TaxID=273540 RepID=A0A9Q0H5T6_9MAGN|nr:hypothetical protein NE237_025203 [Protea cynaroides]
MAYQEESNISHGNQAPTRWSTKLRWVTQRKKILTRRRKLPTVRLGRKKRHHRGMFIVRLVKRIQLRWLKLKYSLLLKKLKHFYYVLVKQLVEGGSTLADKGLVPAKVILGFSGDSFVKQRISGGFLDGTRAPACGALVDNVAERSRDTAFRKNFGLSKQIFEENVSLQSGGVGGDIPVGTESVDTGFKETATKGSPLKTTDNEPEFSGRRGKELRSSPEGGASKKRRGLPASIGGPM